MTFCLSADANLIAPLLPMPQSCIYSVHRFVLLTKDICNICGSTIPKIEVFNVHLTDIRVVLQSGNYGG